MASDLVPPPLKSTDGAPLRLKKRADFLAASKGLRRHGRAFSLQAIRRARGQEPQNNAALANTRPRFGFTVTKKVGNAVVRNRIRRRLREAVRLHAVDYAQHGYDYVLVARIDALAMPFSDLVAELTRALAQIHKKPRVG